MRQIKLMRCCKPTMAILFFNWQTNCQFASWLLPCPCLICVLTHTDLCGWTGWYSLLRYICSCNTLVFLASCCPMRTDWITSWISFLKSANAELLAKPGGLTIHPSS